MGKGSTGHRDVPTKGHNFYQLTLSKMLLEVHKVVPQPRSSQSSLSSAPPASAAPNPTAPSPAMGLGAAKGEAEPAGSPSAAQSLVYFPSFASARFAACLNESSGAQSGFAAGFWKAKADFCGAEKETRSTEGSRDGFGFADLPQKQIPQILHRELGGGGTGRLQPPPAQRLRSA